MEITANAIQEVLRDNNVVFTDVAVGGCPAIVHRPDSGLVKLRGLTNQNRARFRASFGANIAIVEDGTPGEISLTLSLDGEPVQTTRMIVTPTETNQYYNVGTDIYIDIPCGCCSTLGVKNTSGVAINVQNANLIVERIA